MDWNEMFFSLLIDRTLGPGCFPLKFDNLSFCTAVSPRLKKKKLVMDCGGCSVCLENFLIPPQTVDVQESKKFYFHDFLEWTLSVFQLLSRPK